MGHARFISTGLDKEPMTAAALHFSFAARLRDMVVDAWRGAARGILMFIGALSILFSILIAPLPGPLGVPFMIVGLILVLRNSYRLRRLFIRWQRRHPKTVFPLRKLLRKDPEVAAVAYQQALRIEKAILPRSWRVSKDLRRRYLRRKRASLA